MRSFSHINDNIHGILTREFPQFDIEVIDIEDLYSKFEPRIMLSCFREYGMEIALGRKRLSGALRRTPFIFNRIRDRVSKLLRWRNVAFTFQTQSIFDLSVPGIPHFVYTDHTHLANRHYPDFTSNKLFSDAWIDCERRIYRNATIVFSMSSNVSRSVMEDYGCSSEKVKCVYSGANVKAGMDESLDASRYSARNILFVGREWTRKGGPVLLEAFAKVLEVYPDATLSIAGCAPEVSLTNCKVHGLMSLEDVKECYKQASLFCLPTKLEPFGIAFLEAMAHKMPVVGTNVGAIPDFIHHGRNGYLVDPNDTDELARRLVELVGDPQKCMAFGDYGHNLLWERYTWEKTGKRIRESIMGALVS